MLQLSYPPTSPNSGYCVNTSRLRCKPDAGGLPPSPPQRGVLTPPHPPNPEIDAQLRSLSLRTATLHPLNSGNAKRVFDLTVDSFWRGSGQRTLVCRFARTKFFVGSRHRKRGLGGYHPSQSFCYNCSPQRLCVHSSPELGVRGQIHPFIKQRLIAGLRAIARSFPLITLHALVNGVYH
jgi:hypothetical protein